MTISALFPNDLPSIELLESRYAKRNLANSARVTRIGPSPTGMMHLGTVYMGLLNSMLAAQSGGVSILRLEDTDKSREVQGAAQFILESLEAYGLYFDEGPTVQGTESGRYGPYVQSQRTEIYQAFAKHLVGEGRAYPCFATSAELTQIKDQQAAAGVRAGYYGDWAKWRNPPPGDVEAALGNNTPFVIRFRSDGNHRKKQMINDQIFGSREMAENDRDIVILKSDGLPTYHFAHVIDDHLMRTTHVIRGDEWLASVPLHLQLFEAFNWQPPEYAHVAPINKVEGTSRRKLSKRKDPEASVAFFEAKGYPPEAVLEYLMMLADSGFEMWRAEHPNTPLREFPLDLSAFQTGGGPIFDFDKLNFVSRELIANLDAAEVLKRGLLWSKQHDAAFYDILKANTDYATQVLGIERGGDHARKDITQWSDLRRELSFFFDDLFDLKSLDALTMIGFMNEREVSNFLQNYLEVYDYKNNRDIWFAKLKKVALDHGFAARAKDFKADPHLYKGTIAHSAQVLRVLLTGKTSSPDLFSIMQVMGNERILKRLSIAVI